MTIATLSWWIIFICAPGADPLPGGILILDEAVDGLEGKFKSEVNLGVEIAEVWTELKDHIDRQASREGASQFMKELELSASHTFRLSDRNVMRSGNLRRTLDELYCQHVTGERPTVIRAKA